MIIDTSAILAVLFQEPEAAAMTAAMVEAPERTMAAPNFLEASMLLQARKGDEGVKSLDVLIARLRIDIAPFDEDMAHIARAAFKTYGKGRHEASLNFGDCIAFALAQSTGRSLLFKGRDFSQTNVTRAV